MDKMTWTELLLAFAGLAMMLVTVLLAMLAIFGWVSLRQAAEKRAEESASKAIDHYIESPVFDEKVDAAVNQRMKASFEKSTIVGKESGVPETRGYESIQPEQDHENEKG